MGCKGANTAVKVCVGEKNNNNKKKSKPHLQSSFILKQEIEDSHRE